MVSHGMISFAISAMAVDCVGVTEKPDLRPVLCAGFPASGKNANIHGESHREIPDFIRERSLMD